MHMTISTAALLGLVALAASAPLKASNVMAKRDDYVVVRNTGMDHDENKVTKRAPEESDLVANIITDYTDDMIITKRAEESDLVPNIVVDYTDDLITKRVDGIDGVPT